jgi:putative two-component system response regulator
MARAQICIVDDNAVWLARLGRLIEDAGLGDVVSYRHPLDALTSLRDKHPDVLLVDYSMPGMNGIELLTALHATGVSPRTPVALVAASLTDPIKLQAWQAGVMEVLPKSITGQEMALRLRNLIRMAAPPPAAGPAGGAHESAASSPVRDARGDGVASRTEVQRSTLHILERLSALRDENTGKHTERMARYARAIAATLGWSTPQCQLMRDAAPLHDLGKIGIPDSVLGKAGALSREEWDVMRRHTTIGYELLRDQASPALQLGAEIALSHHERWNGTGYPLGLRGVDIPLSGRIVALADVFDALTTVRPYKPAWLVEQAVDQIVADSGTHFDPEVVSAFTTSLDRLLSIKAHYDGEEAFAPLLPLPN